MNCRSALGRYSQTVLGPASLGQAKVLVPTCKGWHREALRRRPKSFSSSWHLPVAFQALAGSEPGERRLAPLPAVPIKVYGANEHGAHAPYMKVPADTLVPLDSDLSFVAGAAIAIAIAIACGTGTAWGALERMGLTGRDTIAVFGQGPVGLSATLLVKARGPG